MDCIAGISWIAALPLAVSLAGGAARPLASQAPGGSAASAPNALTVDEVKAGWRLLFDGKTLNGWHGLGFSTTPPGLWTVEDGAIKHVANGRGPIQKDGQPLTGMDLISDQRFGTEGISNRGRAQKESQIGVVKV